MYGQCTRPMFSMYPKRFGIYHGFRTIVLPSFKVQGWFSIRITIHTLKRSKSVMWTHHTGTFFIARRMGP